MAFGNWNVRVVDLVTNQVQDFGQGWPGGWLSDTVIGITDEPATGNDNYRRQFAEGDVLTGLRTARPDIDIDTVPLTAAKGHIYGANPKLRGAEDVVFYRDGIAIDTSAAGRVALAPNVTRKNVLHLAQPDRGWAGVLVNGLTGNVIRQLPAVTMYGRAFDGPDGVYVSYPAGAGLAGATIINRPDGSEVTVPGPPMDVSDSSGIGVLVWVDGVLWIFHQVWAGTNDQCFAFGRPADGDGQLGICVEMPNLDLDVQFDPVARTFTLVGYAYGTEHYPASYLEAITGVSIDTPRVKLMDQVTPFDFPIQIPTLGTRTVWCFGPGGEVGGGDDPAGDVIEGIGLWKEGEKGYLTHHANEPWLAQRNNTPERLRAIWTSRWDSEHALKFYTEDQIRLLAQGYLCGDIEADLVAKYQAAKAAGSDDFWPIEEAIAKHVSRRTGRPIIYYSDHGKVRLPNGDENGRFDLKPALAQARADGYPVVAAANLYPTEGDLAWETEWMTGPMLRDLGDLPATDTEPAQAAYPVMLVLAAYTQGRKWRPRNVAKKLAACVGLPCIGIAVFGIERPDSFPDWFPWARRWLAALLAALPATEPAWPSKPVHLPTPTPTEPVKPVPADPGPGQVHHGDTPPTTQPKHDDHKAEAIAAGAAAAVGFFAWFKRWRDKRKAKKAAQTRADDTGDL